MSSIPQGRMARPVVLSLLGMVLLAVPALAATPAGRVSQDTQGRPTTAPQAVPTSHNERTTTTIGLEYADRGGTPDRAQQLHRSEHEQP